jgi:DNA-binding GntR family transcriptional regulator
VETLEGAVATKRATRKEGTAAVKRATPNEGTVAVKRATRKRAAAANTLQDVVRRIADDIVFRVYHPRERLVEDELMQRYGAKRHVVRQALAELERDGFVARKPNSGAQVRALTAKETEELYAVREILETSCARLIPVPVDARHIQHLEKLQREHAAAMKTRDVRAVFRANVAFHEAVFRLCPNDALVDAIVDYARRTHPVRLTTLVTEQYLEQARSEHEDILRALRKSDRARLAALCARHLKPSLDAYLRTIEHLN